MSNLTSQEKSIYLNLLILLTTFGSYFGYGASAQSPIRLGGAIVLLIVLQTVSNIILRLTSRHFLIDERDGKAQANGHRVGYIALITFVWMSFGYFQLHARIGSFVVVNLLVLALVVTELSGLVAQLFPYRTSL